MSRQLFFAGIITFFTLHTQLYSAQAESVNQTKQNAIPLALLEKVELILKQLDTSGPQLDSRLKNQAQDLINRLAPFGAQTEIQRINKRLLSFGITLSEESLPKPGFWASVESSMKYFMGESEEPEKSAQELSYELFSLIEDHGHGGKRTHIRRIREILAKPQFNINMQNPKGNTALVEAIRYNLKEHAAMFIAAGANVNMKNIGGMTALMHASDKGYPDIVKRLIAAGANVNMQNEGGITALMYASDQGDPRVVKRLIAADANINMQDINGITALMCAAKAQRKETWKSSLYAPTDYTDVMKLLINANAQLDIQDKNGWTALMLAVRNKLTERAELLINAGANLNMQNNVGSTALIWAVARNNTDLVRLLVRAGADSDYINVRDGNTAVLSYAQPKYLETIRTVIEEAKKERLAYLERQKKAYQVIEKPLPPVLANIAAEYAFGQSPEDLLEEEEKSSCSIQ